MIGAAPVGLKLLGIVNRRIPCRNRPDVEQDRAGVGQGPAVLVDGDRTAARRRRPGAEHTAKVDESGRPRSFVELLNLDADTAPVCLARKCTAQQERGERIPHGPQSITIADAGPCARPYRIRADRCKSADEYCWHSWT